LHCEGPSQEAVRRVAKEPFMGMHAGPFGAQTAARYPPAIEATIAMTIR
jgi:hypothetical protein